MKKSVLPLLVAVPMALTSCLGGEMTNTQTLNSSMVQMKKSNDGEVSLQMANYRYDIDFTAGLIDVTIYDEDIYGAAFVLPDLPLVVSNNSYTFHATAVTPTDASGKAISSLALTDVYGQYFNTLDMRYTVNGTTDVVAIPASGTYMYNTVTTSGEDGGVSENECLVNLTYRINSDSALVDMTMNNAPFASGNTLKFPSINVAIAPSGNYLTLSADTIRPIVNNTVSETYKTCDFTGMVNPAFNASGYFKNENMNAAFKCGETNVTIYGRMYAAEENK